MSSGDSFPFDPEEIWQIASWMENSNGEFPNSSPGNNRIPDAFNQTPESTNGHLDNFDIDEFLENLPPIEQAYPSYVSENSGGLQMHSPRSSFSSGLSGRRLLVRDRKYANKYFPEERDEKGRLRYRKLGKVPMLSDQDIEYNGHPLPVHYGENAKSARRPTGGPGNTRPMYWDGKKIKRVYVGKDRVSCEQLGSYNACKYRNFELYPVESQACVWDGTVDDGKCLSYDRSSTDHQAMGYMTQLRAKKIKAKQVRGGGGGNRRNRTRQVATTPSRRRSSPATSSSSNRHRRLRGETPLATAAQNISQPAYLARGSIDSPSATSSSEISKRSERRQEEGKEEFDNEAWDKMSESEQLQFLIDAGMDVSPTLLNNDRDGGSNFFFDELYG